MKERNKYILIGAIVVIWMLWPIVLALTIHPGWGVLSFITILSGLAFIGNM